MALVDIVRVGEAEEKSGDVRRAIAESEPLLGNKRRN